jgi:hypothetical protein
MKHLDLSVCKLDTSTGQYIVLYSGVRTYEKADLLAQLEMSRKKRVYELIIILPGWNRSIEETNPEAYKKALKIEEKYRV